MTDRIDYLSAHMNDWCLAKAVEKAAGIETNERIETIRTIMAELQRIQSHQLWWGVMAMDLGALTAFLYAFRDREDAVRRLRGDDGRAPYAQLHYSRRRDVRHTPEFRKNV
jgi:NADH:ubiquinone oxidoreductase subunit D